MSDTSASTHSREEPRIVLEVTPIEEEEDDIETLAIVERLSVNLRQEASHLEGLTINLLSRDTSERGLDLILLITVIGTAIVSVKDLLTSIFNLITTIVELLAKRNHVQEIEIIIGGKKLILRELTQNTAKELIEAFGTQHPELSTMLTSRTDIQIKAKVSKKRRLRN